MSNEKMREEFEAWFCDYGFDEESPKRLVSSRTDLDGVPGYALRDEDGIVEEEASFVTTAALLAWQASRAALEVELPTTMGLTRDTRRLVVEAIQSAGVRVKP